MTQKKDAPYTWEAFVQLVLHELKIPTKKDILEIHKRLDKIEQLVTHAHPDMKKEGGGKTWKRKTAAVIVHEKILQHPKGINFKTIKSLTGYDDKKLRNIIYRLDKMGKIEKIGRGVYKPVL